METKQKILLDVAEVAELLDVSERTIYSLEVAGKMPPKIKIGNLNRWRRAEILE